MTVAKVMAYISYGVKVFSDWLEAKLEYFFDGVYVEYMKLVEKGKK